MCEKASLSLNSEKMNVSPETRIMMMRSGQGRPCYKRQILAAFAVSLGPFAAGLSKGYMSPALDNMQDVPATNGSFTVDDQQASWIASLSFLGALIGGILGGMAMQYGRRTVLLVAALPYSLAWLATSFSTSVDMMSITSFLGGMIISCISMTTQVYITEIALPDIRGCLSSVLKILNQIGILIAYSVGTSLNWHQLALVVAAAPILLFIALLFIPETPSSLLLRGKDEKAAESLQWLRGPNADIGQELATIRSNIRSSKEYQDSKSKLAVLFSKSLTRPVLITCGLMFLQRFTGAHVFNFYAVSLFKKTFKMMSPHAVAIATSIVQLLASCLSGMLIDNVGRLPLLLFSGFMTSIALAGYGSYLYYDEMYRNTTGIALLDSGSYDWIPLVCVFTFTIAFSLGISPISSLLIGELFPLKYRSTGSALATSFSHLCGFVNVKTKADFQDLIGLYGLFWLYAGISVLGLLFIVLCVPETKGREIDEMESTYVESLCINR